MYAVCVGDVTNNWVGRLAALYAEQSTTEAEAWKLAEWWLVLHGDKLLIDQVLTHPSPGVNHVESLHYVDTRLTMAPGPGGPITITHPDIIRYFMLIPEAAQLVIQAGAMAKGGDVFVLDMGQPVKIMDLARRMIELSGLRVKNSEHPDGDIEIQVTGLRAGEKLYEELLIGDNPERTSHPQILRAHEEFLPWSKLEPVLEAFSQSLNVQSVDEIRLDLKRLVPAYTL
jgi:hypothetical protein